MQKIIRIVLIIICCVLIVISLLGIGNTMNEYRKSRAEYEALEKMIFTTETQESVAKKPSPATSKNAGEQEEVETEQLQIDRDQAAIEAAREQCVKEKDGVNKAILELRKQNEDVVGWIRFLTLDISYPIMHGETNDEYIRHTWSGTPNSAGSIFLESLNRPDFQDSHSIIYGHNMKNKSMFGLLKEYKVEGTYDKSPFFLIYTGEALYEYQIFAYYDVAETDPIFTVYYEPSESFLGMVNQAYRQSWIDANIPVGKEDKVVTLSTCSTEGRRFIVCAVRVNEY